MLKNILLTITSCIFLSAFSQITLDQNHIPQIGIVHNVAVDSFSTIDPGVEDLINSQTWEYDSLYSNGSNIMEYVSVASSGYSQVTQSDADFAVTLGDQLLIVIPNRFTVYVFPKLASTIGNYQKSFISLFRDAVYPASSEIFELTKEGFRGFGSFRED